MIKEFLKIICILLVPFTFILILMAWSIECDESKEIEKELNEKSSLFRFSVYSMCSLAVILNIYLTYKIMTNL